MKVRIIPPWRNLGCLGFKFGKLYFDIFKRPYFGIFVKSAHLQMWINIKACRLNKMIVDGTEVRLTKVTHE
jgi:hypothetical protein